MKLSCIDVSYSQVAVFQSALAKPFNDWKDRHVAQGFVWRKGSVSFATLNPDGPMEVELLIGSAPPDDDSTAERIISVPFSTDTTGEIEIGSISDSQPLSVPPGDYRLTFEHGVGADGRMWARLVLEPASGTVTPHIVRADYRMSPGDILLMDGVPAV